MAYSATYEAGDLVSIVFDLIGGVAAELADEKAAIGGLILLGLLFAMFEGIVRGGKDIGKMLGQ